MNSNNFTDTHIPYAAMRYKWYCRFILLRQNTDVLIDDDANKLRSIAGSIAPIDFNV